MTTTTRVEQHINIHSGVKVTITHSPDGRMHITRTKEGPPVAWIRPVLAAETLSTLKSLTE